MKAQNCAHEFLRGYPYTLLYPQVLIAEVWLPNTCLDRIQAVLNKAAEGSNTQLHSVVQPITTDEEPPTHYETNKFTACFQTIVEAYGVARYREVCVCWIFCIHMACRVWVNDCCLEEAGRCCRCCKNLSISLPPPVNAHSARSILRC